MSLVSRITALAQSIGADIKALNANKVTNVAGKGLSPLTKEFVSEDTSIPAAGATTFTHGLGVMPRVINISLVCRIAEFGYVVGEEVQLSGAVLTYLTNGMNFGVQLASSQTQIKVKIGSVGIGVLNMTNGIAAQVTPNNWRLIVRAYA